VKTLPDPFFVISWISFRSCTEIIHDFAGATGESHEGWPTSREGSDLQILFSAAEMYAMLFEVRKTIVLHDLTFLDEFVTEQLSRTNILDIQNFYCKQPVRACLIQVTQISNTVVLNN
jgi:hypothetical protein